MAVTAGEPSHCSFCGQTRGDVRFLLTGPSVAICGECVAFAVTQMVAGHGGKFFDKALDVLVDRAVEAAIPAALSGGEFVDLNPGREDDR